MARPSRKTPECHPPPPRVACRVLIQRARGEILLRADALQWGRVQGLEAAPSYAAWAGHYIFTTDL
ncbi:hypothetical protein ColTof4_02654 [Colletotrichum tofieldiae]|nr:hypothetical protein ColTof3_09054 [Colletotrichum tofieldiae]GKT70231.1 hypothetical protein ColTof4_02654 [Colletotrichum tofieldiae]